jgi:hypothetical protein
MHHASCFVTLTYDEANVPWELCKDDYQKFLKRLRKEYGKPLRYFLAAEYGSQKGRPHYHLALFGIDELTAGGDFGISGFRDSGLVQKCWGKGFTTVKGLDFKSASYIAGYVTKKFGTKVVWKWKDQRMDRKVRVKLLMDGRISEFCRMSLKPGIGAHAMGVVVESLKSVPRDSLPWVAPSVLKHSGKLWPLGRYLKGKISEQLFTTDEQDSKKMDQLREYGWKLRAVHEEYINDPQNTERSTKKVFLDTTSQKRLNKQTVFEIYDQEKKL